jgi:diguanylate cyclase (GGDEF)-like protein/PAS domain S-box-containing protein
MPADRETKNNSAAKQDTAGAKRQRIMYEAIPVYCTFWDENFNKIDCNDTAHLFYGLGSKEEYLECHSDLSPERQPDGELSEKKAVEMLKMALEKGRHVFEWMHQTIDGTPLPSEVTLVRVNIDKNTKGVVGYTRDLREVKAAEAKAMNEEAQRKIMVDSMPLGCILWDENFQIIDCNHEASKMLGFSDKAEFLKRYGDLSPEFQPDGERSTQKAERLANEAIEEGACDYEWTHQTLDGEMVPTAKCLFRIDVGNGKFGIAGYTRDLREARAAEAKISEANERLRAMFDNMPIACIYISGNLYLADCNDEAMRIFGASSKKDLLGKFLRLSPKLQPDGQQSKKLASELYEYATTNGSVSFEWMHKDLRGNPIPMAVTIVKAKGMAEIAVIAYMRDLRELRELKDKTAQLDEARQMAFSDALTGVSNRRHFMQQAKQEFRKQKPANSFIGIIMLDMDHFKRINDTYGHAAGDLALKAVSEVARSILRETDLFARYGGEEFIVMVQNLSLAELTNLAERICEKIRGTQFSYGDQEIHLTASAGVAVRNDLSHTIEEVIVQADTALYRAKANGRDRVETFVPMAH